MIQKIKLNRFLGVMALVAGLWQGECFAQSQLPPKSFEIKAFLPPATGFRCLWNRVYDLNPDPDVYDLEFVPVGDAGVVDFESLDDNLVAGVFNKDYYYVCDIAMEGGVVDSPSFDFLYQEGENPNTQPGYSGKGLGHKAVLTVAAVDSNDPQVFTDDTETNLAKVRMNQADMVHIPALGNFIVGNASNVEYHFPRIGIGLTFGDDLVTGEYNILGALKGLEPAEPFTNADRSGDYTGTLIVTMTTNSQQQ